MSRFLASALSLLLASSVAHGAPLNDRRSAPTQLNTNAICTTAWAENYNAGVRMYINSGDQLHELSQQQDILGAGVTPTWTRGNALADMLPNSAIACANSFISQSLLPGDRSTSGREVLRVFYFERGTGNLREMVYQWPQGWSQSDLSIANVDQRKIAALSWAEGGVSKWSLSYTNKDGFMFTMTQTGNSRGNWEHPEAPYFVNWSRGITGGVLQSGLAAAGRHDGAERAIYGQDLSDANDLSKIATFTYTQENGKLTFAKSYSDMYAMPDSPTALSYGVLEPKDNIRRVFVRSGNNVVVHARKEIWTQETVLENLSSENAPVSVATQGEGDSFRMYAISLNSGRITQSTYDYSHGWVTFPIQVLI